MKKSLALGIVLLSCMTLLGQAPENFKYQAVLRDASGNVKANAATSIQLSILQGGVGGPVVYSETHSVTTNEFGLVSLNVGNGTGQVGDIAVIDWSDGSYFLKVTVDGTEFGTSQLLSVPYALYSKTAGNGFSGNYTDLTNKPVLFDGAWLSLNGKPTTIAGFGITDAFSGNYNDLTNKPAFDGTWLSLAGKPTTISGFGITDAFSGNYNDLTNKPTLFSGSYPDLTNKPVLFDGTWSSLTGKPTSLNGYGITDGVNTSGDQAISGTKTFSNTIVASNGVNANSKSISNVADPASAQDAATKAYVDNLIKSLGSISGNYAGTITDYDGNLYTTVMIGNQVWMAQNLKTTKYNDGTSIPLVTDNTAWGNLTTPGYCWYNNNEANKDTYGGLYNWYAVNTGILCPTGWHVPIDAEWTTMENYLIANGFNYDGITTDNKIAKALASTSVWNSSLTAGAVGNTDYPSKRNATGYTALPGGYRISNGTSFNSVGDNGIWWSATEFDAPQAMRRILNYDHINFQSAWIIKRSGHSVRCVRD